MLFPYFVKKGFQTLKLNWMLKRCSKDHISYQKSVLVSWDFSFFTHEHKFCYRILCEEKLLSVFTGRYCILVYWSVYGFIHAFIFIFYILTSYSHYVLYKFFFIRTPILKIPRTAVNSLRILLSQLVIRYNSSIAHIFLLYFC